MTGKTLILLAALLAGAGAAAGADEVDRYVEERMRALHLPGVSLAVVRDGAVVKAAGYGLADLEQGVAATPATVYEIGSNGKQLTAVLTMMLVEEAKLGLDDPLSRFFPGAPEFWSRIAVRHLLSHTGGIRNHVAVPGYLALFKSDLFFGASPGRDELLAEFFRLPQEFAAGATWAYDNTGYILLGWILEQVSGRSYWELLEERIFRPLGMAASGSTDPRPLVPHRASGYGWVEGRFENRAVLWPHVAFSAGSVLSSVEDLARWDAALAGERLLPRAVLERMWTPVRTSAGEPTPYPYGFGWMLDDFHGHHVVHHGGGTPGFSSAFYRFPDDGLAVILLTNRSDHILDSLAIDIAGMYEPALRRTEAAADPDPATTARLRTVFSELLAGRHDPEQFTAPMRLFLATATGQGFGQWYAEHGELTDFRFAAREERADLRLLRYAVTLGGARYWFSFGLAPDGRIARLTCF